MNILKVELNLNTLRDFIKEEIQEFLNTEIELWLTQFDEDSQGGMIAMASNLENKPIKDLFSIIEITSSYITLYRNCENGECETLKDFIESLLKEKFYMVSIKDETNISNSGIWGEIYLKIDI